MKFVVATDRDEILKVIQEAKAKDSNILWQTSSEHRTIFDISQIDYDPIREVIRCKIDEPDALLPELNIYLKLAHRNTVFKGSMQLTYKGYVYIQVPDEIRVEELREHPRYSFYPEERRQITISVHNELMATAKQHHEVNLLDMSRSGMGILINQNLREHVLNGSEINLSTLGNFEFKSLFHLEPVWQIDFPYTTEEGKPELFKKVGIKFKESLPGKLINNYIKLEEGQYENQIGFLGHSNKFRKKLHREYNTMLDKVKRKRKFFDFFKDVASTEEVGLDYLPRHIRLLSMTSCALARLTGYASMEVYSQLAYVAFVHDIAFFNNPKLAQIKNRQHFEKVKQFLNVTEKELYYRSYNYAFDFARQDINAPGGVEYIIHQLKEYHLAPDKQKFLNQDMVAPIVAIFIVAHHLTDYILTHPQWTFYEYLERYPFLIHGNTFERIFEQLSKARIAA